MTESPAADALVTWTAPARMMEMSMIENEEVAKEISKLMLEYGARLNTSVALVKDRCTAEELRAYRMAVGKVMGDMLLEIMNPLYARHPDLKPGELK